MEALGLFKVDLLGLGALSHLYRCFDLLRTHYGRFLSMDTLPKDDPETFDMICEGKTVEVFQIESHAASFAIISYAAAWLRRHFPAVFIAGLLNSLPMGFYTKKSQVM